MRMRLSLSTPYRSFSGRALAAVMFKFNTSQLS